MDLWVLELANTNLVSDGAMVALADLEIGISRVVSSCFC